MRISSELASSVAGTLTVMACSMALAAPAVAQVEVGVEGGYSISEGITASTSRIIQGQVYSKLDVKSGPTWGLNAGVYIGPNYEVEFLYHRQFGEFEISEPAPTKKLAKLDVDSYHWNLVYNTGDPRASMRGFFFGGLGMSRFLPGDYDPQINPLNAALIQSATKFSSTWGGGVKFYPSPKVGVRGTLRWTPTYIKSDAGGLWCDPFYPTCWVLSNPDYVNQFELSGGVTFRFGGR
jgi:opacity protein-like surface antigen